MAIRPPDQTRRPRFRRILMAMESSSSQDLSAVDAAAALAAKLQAELQSVFVEDIDLLRLAEHAEFSTFSLVSASRQTLAADQLKLALRLQLARSRRAVEQAAARQRIKSVFQVRQGRLITEVLSAAEATDLVVLAWTRGGVSLALTAAGVSSKTSQQTLAGAAPRAILLFHPESPAGGPVLVAWDGGNESREALAAAAEIAEREGGTIEVALLASRLDQAEDWRREITAALANSGPAVRFLDLPKARSEDVRRAADRERASLLVLGAGQFLLQSEDGRRLLERIGCSVLIVHRTKGDDNKIP